MENYSILIPSYTVGPKAYEKIYDYCHVYGKKAIVIGGARAMAAAKAKLVQALEGTGMTITGFLCFGTGSGYSVRCGWRKSGRHGETDQPGIRKAVCGISDNRIELRSKLFGIHRLS